MTDSLSEKERGRWFWGNILARMPPISRLFRDKLFLTSEKRRGDAKHRQSQYEYDPLRIAKVRVFVRAMKTRVVSKYEYAGTP
eukprot:scaffold227993_cov37-Prasinocladus_malaysianus.AAC.1